MVCDLVYQRLAVEHRDTPTLAQQDEELPAVTRQQQRLFSLLVALQARDGYQGLMARMVTLLRHAVFGRDRMYHLRVNQVQNMGRMFVLCCRHTDDVELLRRA